MHEARQLAAEIGNTAIACEAMLVPRSSHYRRKRLLEGPVFVNVARPKPRPSRALLPTERQEILDVLHEPRFVDKAPAQVHAALLDEGRYIASVRTMHRCLAAAREGGERRRVRRHPPAPTPSLVATAPNQVWTWDITKLPSVVKGVFFALYVVLDLYSRYVVAWTIARRELASIAKALLRDACIEHGITAGQLTVHSDRGKPMTGKPLVQLYADLGVATSLSRPRVSNDNPFSESQFRTAKDDPDYPGRFTSLQHGCSWATDFIPRYNTEHRHSSLAMLTPEDVFTGRGPLILAQRHEVMLAAYAAHPERFVHGPPQLQCLPTEVWINPPARSIELEGSH